MIVFFLVSFLACTAGAICGMGGGVIIKPVLDILGLETVTTARFLSSCTVLGMSCYSVLRNVLLKESRVDMKTGLPLMVGAAAGGAVGKSLFAVIKGLFENQNTVGAVQAGCLAALTVVTLIYTLRRDKIQSLQVKNPAACGVIGLLLGIMSSFLGIGGGPINLAVLFFFFGMETKTAATTSLYIILFCQATNLMATFLGGGAPEFRWPVMALMVIGGICGGMVGRKLSRKMERRSIDRLFALQMVLIICLNIYNVWKFTHL